jgi:hypothetical protein
LRDLNSGKHSLDLLNEWRNIRDINETRSESFLMAKKITDTIKETYTYIFLLSNSKC